MLRNSTWTLSNFCRGKPQPSFEQTKPALHALKRLINSTDEEVLTDTCWALFYLTVQMTKFKLLLKLVPVTDLLSYCFAHLLLYSFPPSVRLAILLLEMIVRHS